MSKKIGEDIKRLRNELRLPREEFALILGCSASAVRKWERGGSPGAMARERIAEFVLGLGGSNVRSKI